MTRNSRRRGSTFGPSLTVETPGRFTIHRRVVLWTRPDDGCAPIVRHLEFYPSFDYFIDSGSFWNLNADLKYRIPSESVRWLYLGAGLNIAHGGGDTQAGLNLLAGIESLKGRVHPFGEFRFTANHGSTGQIAVGLNFTLGR
jgi:hypothetical protein